METTTYTTDRNVHLRRRGYFIFTIELSDALVVRSYKRKAESVRKQGCVGWN